MTSATPAAKIVLIDGHSLAFRAYFAFAKGRDGGLRTSTGIPTSVCFGFLKALLETMEAEKPDYLAIAFDLGGATYRHDADVTYKAGRPETPADFIPDLNNLQELLQALNLPIVFVPGYEADDVIGTLARRACAAGLQVKILSGDRDLFQLVDEAGLVKVLYLSGSYGKGAPPPKEFGVQEVHDKMGVLPSQVVDFKALCGDPSDNIPGVRGIGEKTAATLLEEYGSLEQVYLAIDQIKGATKKKLEEGKEAACHSQWMAQIHLDVPLDLDLEGCKIAGFDEAAVLPILEKLEFKTFIDRLQKLRQQFAGVTQPEIVASAIEPLGLRADDGDLWFFSVEDTATAQLPAVVHIQPQIIDTLDKLTELLATLQTFTDPAMPVAWDTETTALEPRDAAARSVALLYIAPLPT